MGKLEMKKTEKKNALFQNAFELFTDKGFAKTTIADIVQRAGLAKGTFYLYFKDKYDLRDKLIAYKAGQLFSDAHIALANSETTDFEEHLLFLTDYIIGRLQAQPSLLRFIAKNLSWGIFRNVFSSNVPQETIPFYDYYLECMTKNGILCREPEIMFFTIIELISSTCYSCILYNQPVPMEKYLPYLHQCVLQIFHTFTGQAPDNAPAEMPG